MPPLKAMLYDIGSPSVKEIAKALRVHETTVRKWLRTDEAPHPVMLAIFWMTRWGVSAIDCDAHNAAVLSASIARNRQEQIDSLEGRIQRLAQIANFGSANDPAPGVVPLASMPVAPEISGETTAENHFQPGYFQVPKSELNQVSMRATSGLTTFEKLRADTHALQTHKKTN
jgi:hypothetical protein